MMGIRLRAGVWVTALLALTGAALPAAAAGGQNVAGVSMEDYREHLEALEALTLACAKERDKAGCDPEKIGADDNVNLGSQNGGSAPNAETRVVRYDWLRALFLEAQKPDSGPDAKPSDGKKAVAAGDATLPAPKTTTQLLDEAQTRLAEDAKQAGAPVQVAAHHAAESETMRKVLAAREFRGLEQLDPRQSVYERVMGWLNKFFNGVGSLLSGAAWVGRLLVWGFLLAVAVGLAWGLLQLERRWRVRLVADAGGPAAGAASARDWQLWMEDARRAAEAGLWREAIHFLYWAAISRLESKRLWPADRARTPREYLALVAPEDPRKAGLAALTGSFERVWYGGRAAGEDDYRRADELAAALIGGEAR